MSELPTTYKACVYDQPGKISTKIVDLNMPEPGHGEVLIKLTHSGICHSDLAIMTNRSMPDPIHANQVGGHEGIGSIVKMGPNTETSVVKLGDRVGIKWISSTCGSCLPCLSGRDGVCFNRKVSGYHTPGTFQQYVVGPAGYVTPIPESLDSEYAAPMLCAGVTAFSALRKSGAKSGEWIVLMGAGGGLGHLAVQIAARSMGMRVIGIDSPSKKDLILQSGAEAFINHLEGDSEAEVKRITGGLGAQAVLVLTGVNAAYASGMMLLRYGGTLVVVGLPEGELQPIATAFPSLMIANALNIVAISIGDRKEAIETLELAERGILKTHLRTVKMEELTSVFEEMESQQLQGRVVLDLR